jgi:nucleoside-diphosphate-sugar epimerase
MNKTILLSGITGFLGSHIAEKLLFHGYSIIALYRSSSDMDRCKEFKAKVHWINVDKDSWKDSIISEFQPCAFIHSAWYGVTADKRDNWESQMQNLHLTFELLQLAKACKTKTVIGLGSQAEYGHFSGRIDENHSCNPFSPYGTIKFSVCHLLRSFCEQNSMKWFWLRLFSVYGPKEAENWLIPSVINNILKNHQMALTRCEQRYDYLYVSDFAEAIVKVIASNASSGVFNLSSNTSIRLFDFIEMIRKKIKPDLLLNYGALEYRPNQVMYMEGNAERFMKTFDFQIPTFIENNIDTTISYYMNRNVTASMYGNKFS